MLFLHRSLLILLVVFAFTVALRAQQPSQKPSPSPAPSATPVPVEQEPPVRVFTEEVRLPVIAVDAYGHYDPTLEVDDVLVLEDGVAQQVRSVRHIPASVLFLLDTGGELSGVGGVSKSTNLTKQTAMDLVQRLPEGTWISVVQSGNSAQVIQSWTRDRAAVLKTLKTKLVASKRSRFSDALVTASQQLKERPEGSRHVVMITDGVDSPGGKTDRAEALKKLIAARATVHVISYTEFVRQTSENKTTAVSPSVGPPGPITQTDPTLPPGQTRSPSYGVSIRFDPAMKRQRKAYEADVKKSESVLANVADETGGKFLLPLTSEEMIAKASEVARAIGAEYVITYRPKRPLAEAQVGEYRKIEVSARRVGLSLHSRRGYIVPTREE